jgi:hypothetical protein
MKRIPRQQEPLKVRAVKLTPTLERHLQRLSRDASDALGWPVSHSAVMRALIRQAGTQPPTWAASELHPLIEAEMAAGRVWGKQSK